MDYNEISNKELDKIIKNKIYLNKELTEKISDLAFVSHVFILDETCNFLLDYSLCKNKSELFDKWNKSNKAHTVFGEYRHDGLPMTYNSRINIG